MTGKDRKKCFEICISNNNMDLVLYFFDLFRDFRDNFSRELWDSIGYKDISVYSSSETLVAFIVLVVMVLHLLLDTESFY
jgi:hypothetical protein